jgi:phospholipase/lecithinase/hemolysin
VIALLLGPLVFPAQAAFSSLYVFGDGVCSTTNGPGGSLYYGNRFCNGRVWVEVLAQRQGLGANSITNVSWSYSSNNWSYYGHYSSQLVTNVNNFTAPLDASNALFVIWCADADFVWNVQNYGTNITQWTNAINQSLTNHFKAITNLYHAKGARTLILPNAVDLTKVPHFSHSANKSFIRQRTIDFNATFTTTLVNQIKTNCPNITIYVPDVFTRLDDMVAHSTNYGLIKPGTFVWEDLPPTEWGLDGPGANYVFWDDLNPTAKAHAVIAEVVQQLISPAQISNLTLLNGSNRLDVANLPIGRDGFVEGCTNFDGWTTEANITSTNATQTTFVPASSPLRFYRLRFPFTWSWP